MTATEFFQRGIERERTKDFLGALADFRAVLELDPTHAEAYYWRAWLVFCDVENPSITKVPQMTPEQRLAVIADMEQAIHYAIAQNNRAALAKCASFLGIVRGLGVPGWGLDLYNRVLEHDPQNADYWTGRGDCHSVERRDTEALADYAEAIRLDPRHMWAYRSRGELYERQRNRTAAAEDYRRVLELQPTQYRAAYMRDYVNRYGKKS